MDSFGGITRNKNTVVLKLKFNIWLNIFGIMCCLTAALILFEDVTKIMTVTMIYALISGGAGIFLLIIPFIFKIILDDEGITRKTNICFLGFTILGRSTLTQWNAVSYVHYASLTEAWINRPAGFRFYHGSVPQSFTDRFMSILDADYKARLDCFMSITPYHDNYKKGIEYAVKKLPPDIFSEDAQYELNRMGIWDGKFVRCYII